MLTPGAISMSSRIKYVDWPGWFMGLFLTLRIGSTISKLDGLIWWVGMIPERKIKEFFQERGGMGVVKAEIIDIHSSYHDFRIYISFQQR